MVRDDLLGLRTALGNFITLHFNARINQNLLIISEYLSFNDLLSLIKSDIWSNVIALKKKEKL